jgi:hypothetical protein
MKNDIMIKQLENSQNEFEKTHSDNLNLLKKEYDKFIATNCELKSIHLVNPRGSITSEQARRMQKNITAPQVLARVMKNSNFLQKQAIVQSLKQPVAEP